MEEILDLIKERLASVLDIRLDEDNLSITLIIKRREQIIGNLAEPNEVKDMLRMLGGLKEDPPMNIQINNAAGEIILKFQSKEDLNNVKDILDGIWEKTIAIFEDLVKGNYEVIKDMGDFND
jgi:hypothetical protein